jgi:hypothetical protein
MDQGRDIGGIGIAISDKSFAIAGFEDCGFECPSCCGRVREFPNALYIYPRTFPPLSNSQEARMVYIPASIKVKHIA